MIRLSVFILLLVNIITSEVQSAVPVSPALSVTISADETVFSTGLPVLFKLTNNSSQAVHVLKWGTPLEKVFNHDMFVVKQGNSIMPYIGRMVTRLQPQADDFVTLQPDESISQTIDIADGYEVYDAGDYTILFDSLVTLITGETINLNNTNQAGSDNRHLVHLKSTAITATLFTDRERIAAKVAPAFSSCSVTQQNKLDEVLTQAEILADKSFNALISTDDALRPNANRYNTWFGSYTRKRYDRVSENFERIHDILANRQVTFDCHCDPSVGFNVIAYIEIPNINYKVHICNLFWFQQLTGIRSQSGILVHEISHFDDSANTRDHVYEKFSSQSLAKTNPDKAIQNADNYEFFAENIPFLSMLPEQGMPSDNIAILNINQPVITNITEDVWIYYKVSGVSRIKLFNMTNDFDLYVKADELPTLYDFDCRPYQDKARVNETCLISETGTYFVGVKLYSGNNISFDGGTFTLLADIAPAAIPLPKPGLWWSPEKADGNGFDIQVNGNQLTVAWYTYDESGLPIWYLADGTYSNNQGIAILRQYRSDFNQITSQEIGEMQIEFSDSTHANLTWLIGDNPGNQNIEYFSVSNQATVTNHTGLWYEPEFPGYGITVHEQGSTIVTVLYYYSDAGNPHWVLGGNQDGYVLKSYSGACPYCAPTVTTVGGRFGDMDINFFSRQSGTLTIRYDGFGTNWRDNVKIINLTP